MYTINQLPLRPLHPFLSLLPHLLFLLRLPLRLNLRPRRHLNHKAGKNRQLLNHLPGMSRRVQRSQLLQSPSQYLLRLSLMRSLLPRRRPCLSLRSRNRLLSSPPHFLRRCSSNSSLQSYRRRQHRSRSHPHRTPAQFLARTARALGTRPTRL